MHVCHSYTWVQSKFRHTLVKVMHLPPQCIQPLNTGNGLCTSAASISIPPRYPPHRGLQVAQCRNVMNRTLRPSTSLTSVCTMPFYRNIYTASEKAEHVRNSSPTVPLELHHYIALLCGPSHLHSWLHTHNIYMMIVEIGPHMFGRIRRLLP